MCLRQAVALALALALVGGIIVASVSYYSWERSRVVQSFNHVKLPQFQYYIAPLAVISEGFINNLSSASTPSQVESTVNAAYREFATIPQLKPLLDQIEEALNLTRKGGGYYLMSQSYYSKGNYTLAAYYANLSLQYLARANATIYSLMSYIYAEQAELGPQAYQDAMKLVNRALGVTGLFTGEDYLELKIIQLSVARKVNGLVTVDLRAPAHYKLGQKFYVNGTVLVNGSSPLGNALVEVGVGDLNVLAVSNSSGYFSVGLQAVFNASGMECVHAKVIPTGSLIINRSLTSYVCGQLSFVPTRLNVSVRPPVVMPGHVISIYIRYSNASCSPAYTVTLGSLSYGGVINNGTATVNLTVPLGLSGYNNVSVTTSQYGSCAPSSASAEVYIYRPPDRPGKLSAWALSPGVLVVSGASPVPSRLSISFGDNEVNGLTSRGSFILILPLLQPQLAFSVNVTMYPVNATFSPYSQSVRAASVPTEVPVAAAVALLYALRRRRTAPSPLMPRKLASVGALNDAWDLLVRMGRKFRVPVLPSTTIRELSGAIASRRVELADRLSSLADLMERVAYGGLRDEAAINNIKKLVDELRRSEGM
ncbi:DUF4129 domain-containing protein [Acidilobus saccharovorans]|uniref:DUF4129 domain-containing protein n=1 Tax=Acidilobus saccharovorans TaxID=242703 RepID=UPI0006625616|nr:DUF4129 domain-containing protein [Acidilobus saccharovorans]